MILVKPIKYLFAIYLLLSLSCCGGGGGGGSEPDPLKGAVAWLEVSNTSIAIGDRTEVKIFLEDIDQNGVLIKVRYTPSIGYISGTLQYLIDQKLRDADPTEGPETSPEDQQKYLLFFVSPDRLQDQNSAVIIFQMRGLERNSSAPLEIDTDLHDPDKLPPKEFNIKKPLFSADDKISIEVRRSQ